MKSIVLLLAATLTSLPAQGPLTPPGAPAPTMKTLAQIEGRTPIESLPFTISQSGSYYFTGNLRLDQASGHAIAITSPNVTLDLNGFTLSSIDTAAGDAINVADNLNNITIRNGIITGHTVVTVSGTAPAQTWNVASGGFSYGIRASATAARNLRIEHIQVSGCRVNGIRAIFGRVSDCEVLSNGGVGLVAASSTVSQCRSLANGGHGILANFGAVTDCTASSNASDGIHVETGSVRESTASSNGGDGILSTSGTVTDCIASSNARSGIQAMASVVGGSTASSNGFNGIRIDDGTVSACVAASNTFEGIVVNNGVVANSTCRSNGRRGIFAHHSAITGSTASYHRASNSTDGGIEVLYGSVANCVANHNDNGINMLEGSVQSSTAVSNERTDMSAARSAIAESCYNTSNIAGSQNILTGNRAGP